MQYVQTSRQYQHMSWCGVSINVTRVALVPKVKFVR